MAVQSEWPLLCLTMVTERIRVQAFLFLLIEEGNLDFSVKYLVVYYRPSKAHLWVRFGPT